MHQVAQLAVLIAVAITIPVVLAENDSIYEILKANALPMGLLPKGVREFSVDVETGDFSVFLNQSCKAKYESELHYEAKISGTIGYGSIGALSGISAQELFLWFPVKGIRVDIPSSGVIYFDVGVVRKQYSMSLFETPRDCVAVENDGEFKIKVPEETLCSQGLRNVVVLKMCYSIKVLKDFLRYTKGLPFEVPSTIALELNEMRESVGAS